MPSRQPLPFQRPRWLQLCGREGGSPRVCSTGLWGSHVAAWPNTSWHPSPARPLWLGWGVQRTLPATFTGAPTSLQAPTLGAHTARMADTDPQCSVRPGPRPPAPSGCPLGAVRPAACTLVPAGPRPPWGPAGRSVLEERAARGPCSRPSALPSQREARSGVHCAPTADQGVGRPRSASSVGAGSGEGHGVWRPKCHRTGAWVRRSACLEGALKPGQGLRAGRD